MRCDTMAEASDRLRPDISIAEVLAKWPAMRDHWERGRFLGKLARLAATACSPAEAAAEIGCEAEQLESLLANDIEVADTWNQARLDLVIDCKRVLVEQLKAGKAAAIAQIERILRSQIATAHIDFHRVTVEQLTAIVGRSRQTIYNWSNHGGLRANADGSYDLAELWRWREEDLARQAAGRKVSGTTDPLRAARAEQVELAVAAKRGELLARDEVIAGFVARAQGFLLATGPHQIADLAQRIAAPDAGGSGRDARVSYVSGLIGQWIGQIRAGQCSVPEMLRLPADKAAELQEFIESLQPQQTGNTTDGQAG